MIDEKGRRRADFVAGAAIRLADGQCWTLPLPAGALEGPGPGGEAGAPASFGPGYEPVLEAVREAEDDADALRAELALAICLLRRNYDLGPDDFATLLGFADGDDLARMQREMTRVASAHLRAFRPRRRPARGAAGGRLVRPSAVRAFST